MTILLILALFFSWLVVLTWITLTTKKHYQQLTTRTRKNSIDEILDMLLKEGENNQEELKTIKKKLEEIQKKGQGFYQKIGLIRFNPFDRMGGDHSFVFALLDENKNGIILNFIHTKDGLRVYTKRIKNGTGIEHELSEEEKKAIESSK